ncbi:hypothetical protein, partial [Microlunatus ginsengisoli]|uniref:hypothetical protein n=1 Tax=Microlunatus ginsengisoli TaxID=363863 RepID=UPI0031D059AC
VTPATPLCGTQLPSRWSAHIVVRDEFGPALANSFRGCDVTASGGSTQLTVQHQTDLHSILDRLQDLGASLLSLTVDKSDTK